MYFTDPMDNPFSRGLTALDENGQSGDGGSERACPGPSRCSHPGSASTGTRAGDRNTQVRGGTGIFTGRVPFVWFGNVISNPGANPNLFPVGPVRETG